MRRAFVKKSDIIITLTLIAVCAAVLAFRYFGSGEAVAVVCVGGEEYARAELRDGAQQVLRPDAHPGVVIRVEGREVFFESADCPDKLCVKAGRLSRVGDTAACLPAGVVISLEGAGRKIDAISG